MTFAAPICTKSIIAERHSVKTASVPNITHMSDEIWKVQEHHHLHLQVKYDCHSADYQATGLVTGIRLQMDRWLWSPNEVLFILFHKERLNSCSCLRCEDLCYICVCVFSFCTGIWQKWTNRHSGPDDSRLLIKTCCSISLSSIEIMVWLKQLWHITITFTGMLYHNTMS